LGVGNHVKMKNLKTCGRKIKWRSNQTIQQHRDVKSDTMLAKNLDTIQQKSIIQWIDAR
jgi:hypothetical protein